MNTFAATAVAAGAVAAAEVTAVAVNTTTSAAVNTATATSKMIATRGSKETAKRTSGFPGAAGCVSQHQPRGHPPRLSWLSALQGAKLETA